MRSIYLYRSGFYFTLLLILLSTGTKAQTAADSITRFYYPSGKLASEGVIRDGQPDGYWKTYYENGLLKSEGNRKNFLLDSLWIFYSDSGNVVLQVNYREGKKSGIRKTWQKDVITEEIFENDIKNGISKIYFSDGRLKRKVSFVDGREEGIAREYSADGLVINLTEYRRGYIISSENINRYREGQKHGPWITFYEDEKIKTEENYFYGKRDGYFKEYGQDGNLISITKYINDELIPDAPELARYDIKTEYYRNGKIKTVTSYKDGIPEGVRREYSPEGQIIRSFIYRNGIVAGEGIVDEQGFRQGAWKLFHEGGELEAEGTYNNNNRTGPWKFYFRNGVIEQSGTYNAAGKIQGVWKWFYESGKLRREETFENGLPDGMMKEYSDSGNIIVSGSYSDGEEDGPWQFVVGDIKEEGSYQNGKKEGEWRLYSDEILIFKGGYIDGNPNGEHTMYWDNGRIRERGRYIMGKKEGEWIIYNYDGTRLLSVYFVDGVEKSYDGVRIEDKTDQKNN